MWESWFKLLKIELGGGFSDVEFPIEVKRVRDCFDGPDYVHKTFVEEAMELDLGGDEAEQDLELGGVDAITFEHEGNSEVDEDDNVEVLNEEHEKAEGDVDAEPKSEIAMCPDDNKSKHLSGLKAEHGQPFGGGSGQMQEATEVGRPFLNSAHQVLGGRTEPKLADGNANLGKAENHVQSTCSGGMRSWADIVGYKDVKNQTNDANKPRSWRLVMNSARSGMELEYFAFSNNCSGIIDIGDDLVGDEPWLFCAVSYFLGPDMAFGLARAMARTLWGRFGLVDVFGNNNGFLFFKF
ncbi:hypothetical protein U1Q18_044052 [Sarracenia purpurea var. burkii]